MKKRFSTKWKGSSQARKQRKYKFNAPLHIKQKFTSCNLSKDLRKNYGRSIQVRKNDVVKVLTGKFKGKKAKVIDVDVISCKVTIEGVQQSKKDGSKAPIRFHPSNLQITELNTDDKKRLKKKENKQETKNTGKENKEDKK